MSIIYADGKNPYAKSIEDRFWKKVNKKGKDDCWNWIGSCGDKGYGMIGDGCGGVIRAHRLSWKIHFRFIPIGKFVLHKCDNRLCVNPKHLYLGTQSDNIEDRKLRNLDGQGGRTSNFYIGEAWLMKKLWESGKLTQKYIGKMFKCSKMMVSLIVNEKITNFK